jgi:hypothetical protein
MPKRLPDYSATTIYKLCCNDKDVSDIYIGHTTNVPQRKHQHKTCSCNENCNIYLYRFIRDNGGWDNWSMEELAVYECKNKREALIIERICVDLFGASLNTNKPYSTTEEKNLQKQLFYEKNKEAILAKAKLQYELCREQKIAYSAKYAEKHKDKITAYNKEYTKLNAEKLKEQKKIYRENNKEAIKLSIKKWTEENKEKIKEQNSQVINCECGHSYKFGSKYTHLKSDKHNNICKPVPVITEIMKQEKELKIKEQQQAYRKTHSEQIKQYKKSHYEQHKDKIMEQNNAYREAHKEEIIEKQKEYVENNKDKIKARQSEWYQANKDKIKAKQTELITCECGSTIRRGGYAEHCKSVKHKEYLLVST